MYLYTQSHGNDDTCTSILCQNHRNEYFFNHYSDGFVAQKAHSLLTVIKETQVNIG